MSAMVRLLPPGTAPAAWRARCCCCCCWLCWPPLLSSCCSPACASIECISSSPTGPPSSPSGTFLMCADTSSWWLPLTSIASTDSSEQGMRGKVTSKLMRSFSPRDTSTYRWSTVSTLRNSRSSLTNSTQMAMTAMTDTMAPPNVFTLNSSFSLGSASNTPHDRTEPPQTVRAT